MKNTVEKINFRVAGVTNYRKAVKQACDDIVEDNAISEHHEYYSGLTAEEIREELEEVGGRIFKYQDLTATEVELVPEPDNKYDSNAIRVLIFDNFVGYVPSKIAKNIRHYFDDNRYIFISEVEIKGGPYKEWNEYEEKIVTNNDLDVGFEIYLTIIDSSRKEENQNGSNDTNLSEEFPKNGLIAHKIIFSALYIFLIFFGFVGVPIAPFISVPLIFWSMYRIYKLFKK